MSTNDVALLALQMGERLANENKRLRALSADLLAALEVAYARLDPMAEREEDMAQIRAAIAKAKEGRS